MNATKQSIDAIVKWVVDDMKVCKPQMTAYDDHCLRKEVTFHVTAAVDAALVEARRPAAAFEKAVEHLPLKQGNLGFPITGLPDA